MRITIALSLLLWFSLCLFGQDSITSKQDSITSVPEFITNLKLTRVSNTRYIEISYTVVNLLPSEMIYVMPVIMRVNKTAEEVIGQLPATTLNKKNIRGELGWIKKNGNYKALWRTDDHIVSSSDIEVILKYNIVPKVGLLCPDCMFKKAAKKIGERTKVPIGSILTATLLVATQVVCFNSENSGNTLGFGGVGSSNDTEGSKDKVHPTAIILAAAAVSTYTLTHLFQRKKRKTKPLKNYPLNYKYQKFSKKVPKSWKKYLPSGYMLNK